MRDEGSTTYAGAIEGAEGFGRCMYRHAWDRGWSHAKEIVIITDGAVWIWNIAGFPGAIRIVDIYHAREHLWGLRENCSPSISVSENVGLAIETDRRIFRTQSRAHALSGIPPQKPLHRIRRHRSGL